MAKTLFTTKCTLVPSVFYKDDCAGEYLAQVVVMDGNEQVFSYQLPQYASWLVWGVSPDCETLELNSDPEEGEKPELYYILRDLQNCPDYNKILLTWRSGVLHLAIAQGKTLLLANTYAAPDFAAAQYYLFLAMKSLQLNPEVSTVCTRMPLSAEQEISLYRYFKAVEQFRAI